MNRQDLPLPLKRGEISPELLITWYAELLDHMVYPADVRPYIENKKYASAKHKSDVIYPNGEGKTRLLLYSVPLEQFADERSSIEALKGYLFFLKKEGIELELV